MAVDMSISAEFTADSKGFTSGIKKCQDALSGFGKSLEKLSSNVSKGLKGWGVDFEKFYSTGSGVLDKFGISVDTFAAKLGTTGPVVAAITAVTVAATKLGQEFNSAMAEIAKGTGATGDSLLEFNENLQNLMISGVGSSMNDIATSIADLNTRFGSTGVELETLANQFDQFSNVTGQNVHQAVNDVADVINKWGMETKDIKPLLDQLTKAGQDSGVSVQFLAQTLTQSKTVFSQFGMSATTSIAFVEQLAKAGVDTNTAMTGMRYALSKFSAEGKNSQKAFQEIGDSIKNAETDSEALTIALEAFGSKAGAEMINVFRNGKYSIDDFTKSLRSAGGVVEATDRATKTSKDAMAELLNTLKGMTSGFGQGFDVIFRDLLNSLQMVAGAVAPIIQPIGNAFRDIVSVVSGSVKQVISLIVEVVTEIKNVFATSDMVKSVHKALKSLFGVFEDVFGLIIAILQGKWVLAWEYAKNAMLKVCDAILDALSSWLNFMKEPVNGFIKYVINPLIDAWNLVHISAKDKVDKIEPIGEIDLSGLTGLTSAITESNNKIAELTGKTTKQITGDLGKVKDIATDVATSVEKDASKSLSTVSQWEQKLIQQEIERLKREKENAVIKAENEKKSEKKIYDIKKDYDDKIIALQIQKLELDKKAALEQITDAKEIERVNKYYENEILALKEKNVERIKEIQEQASQWETKLLAQRIAILEQEEDMKIAEAKAAGKTEREIYQTSKNYGVKIINLKIEQLNNQKAIDLTMATGVADRYKIEEYYAKQITYITNQEYNKRKEAHKKNNEEEGDDEESNLAKIVHYVGAAVQAIGNVFGKLTQVTKKIVSGVAKAVKGLFSSITAFAKTAFNGMVKVGQLAFKGFTNVFKGIAKGFKSALDFNPDAALDSLLAFEDKILTFFVVTLPRLPSFFESAIGSIVNLIDRLISSVDMSKIAKIMQSIINTIATYAPIIIQKAVSFIAELFTTVVNAIIANAPQLQLALSQIIQSVMTYLPKILNSLIDLGVTILTSIANVLVENADIIVNGFGQVFIHLFDNLPTIMQALSRVVLTLLQSVSQFILANQQQITNDISNTIAVVIEAVSTFISNGGAKTVLGAVVNLMKGLIQAVVDNIPALVEAITGIIPDIVNAIGEIVMAVMDNLPVILGSLAKIILTLVQNIGTYISQNQDRIAQDLSNIVSSIIGAISEFVKNGGWRQILNAIIAIVNAINKALIDNIDTIVDTVAEMLPELVDALIKIIVDINKASSKIMPKLMELVFSIIRAILDLITNQEVIETSIDVLVDLIAQLIKQLIINLPVFIPLIIKGILTLVGSLIRHIPKLVAMIIQGLVEAFIHTNWGKVIKEAFTAFIDGIKGFFGIHSPSTVFKKFGEFMVKGLANGLKGIWNAVKNIFSNLASNIKSVFTKIFDSVTNIVSKLVDGVKNAFSNMLNGVKTAVSNIGSTISSIGKGLVDGVKNTITGIGNGISSVFSTIVNSVKNAVSNIGNAISSIGSGLVDGVKNTISNIGNGISSVFTTIVNGVKTAVSNIGSAIASIGSGLVEKVKSTITGIGNGISSVFTNIVSKVGGFVSDIGDKILSIGSSIKDLGSEIWDGLTSGIKNVGSKIGDGIKSGFNTAIRAINTVINKLNDTLQISIPSVDLPWWMGGHSFGGWSWGLDIPNIPELAIGTPNALRGLTLVGEAGPELVDFRGGERVYNNHNTEKMLANTGKSNSFNIVFNNTSQTTAFTIMREFKKYNRELAFNGVL